MIETAAGPVTDRPVRPRTLPGVEIGCARARRSRTSRSGPSGLRRAEAFRNSRGCGLGTRCSWSQRVMTTMPWSVPAFLLGGASVDASLLRRSSL